MNEKIIMAWSKTKVNIKPNEASGLWPSGYLFSVGVVKDKSSTLEASEGEKLEMRATGGELVATEQLEGGFQFKTRVIEPSRSLATLLRIALRSSGGTTKMATHVVAGYWALEVAPKNIGARGLQAPWCKITYAPGWSEEDGNYADLTFDILKGAADYWYDTPQTTAECSFGSSILRSPSYETSNVPSDDEEYDSPPIYGDLSTI